jgi:hypothetical protein
MFVNAIIPMYGIAKKGESIEIGGLCEEAV